MDWTAVAAAVAVVGMLVSLFQWHVNQNYKRLNEKFAQWAGSVTNISSELHEVRRMASQTRAELYKHYVNVDQLNSVRGEMRDLLKEIHEESKAEQDKIYSQLRGISREVSTLVGIMRGKGGGDA